MFHRILPPFNHFVFPKTIDPEGPGIPYKTRCRNYKIFFLYTEQPGYTYYLAQNKRAAVHLYERNSLKNLCCSRIKSFFAAWGHLLHLAEYIWLIPLCNYKVLPLLPEIKWLCFVIKKAIEPGICTIRKSAVSMALLELTVRLLPAAVITASSSF